MHRAILRLAIPNIVSNISVPLLATVDTILMGRLSADHLGAVGLGSMLFSFVYWNFGFLRMGTTGLTSQAYGADKRSAIGEHLLRAVVLAIGIASVILLIQGPFYRVSSQLLQVLPQQQSLVGDYFSIRIWAAPATLLLYVVMGWFFGLQNALYPMILTIAINIINIAVSYIAVRYMGLEARGVAWGTLIAQYAGLLLAALMILHRYRHYLTDIRLEAIKQTEALRAFLQINKDLFIRTVCLTLAFGFFYSKSSEAGALVLGANVILLQLVNWMSYGIDGFAYASEALTGKYYGAKDEKGLRHVVRLCLLWGGGLAVAYSLVYGLGSKRLLYLFTDDVAVVEEAYRYLWWMIVLPIVGYACYIWDGVFVGMTASKALRNTMLVAVVAYLSVYYLVDLNTEGHRLWLSLCVLLAARGVLQTYLYRRYGVELT